MNNNEITGVLFADFAKAFDVIDHTLLLKKLKLYGLSSNTLNLLSSFLSDRKQLVSINGSQSSLLPVHFGIPQGSVLGPVLFSIYINDLPLFIEIICEMFADDTTLHTSHGQLDIVCRTIQENINKLIEWTELNHMSLHPKKSKFMLITTRQKRQNFSSDPYPISINGETLEEAVCHKILGIVVDNNLSWSNHISTMCKTLSKKIYQLSKIKHFLNDHSRKLYFIAYIESYINYASTVWDSASENILKPLKSIHRRGLKLIILKSSSLTIQDYSSLNILPLKSKLLYNKAIFMYKIMHGYVPQLLVTKFIHNSSRHNHKIMVPLPRIDLFKSSLLYSGGCLWNILSTKLNTNTSLNVFKKTCLAYFLKDLSTS